jgi:hypothetical protein
VTRKGVSRRWGVVALQSLIVALWGIRLMLGLRITSLVAYEFVKRRGSPPSPTSSPLQRIPDAHFTSRFFLLLCCLPHISPRTNTTLSPATSVSLALACFPNLGTVHLDIIYKGKARSSVCWRHVWQRKHTVTYRDALVKGRGGS